MEGEKMKELRRKRRKPLSDCSNTIASSSIKPSFSSAIKNLLKSNDHSDVISTGSTNNCENAQNPSSTSLLQLPLASTPSRPLKSASLSGDGEVSEPCTVYRRRQTADKRQSKGKTIPMPLSCSTLASIRDSGDKMNEDGDIGLSKQSTVPPKKKQHRTLPRQDVSKHALSQDFINQQRAYFAEIDAFELPEEEVASVNELE